MNYLEASQTNNWLSSNSNSQPNNLILVDSNLTNYQNLIPDTNSNQLVLIDSQQNGIEQISEALARYSNLDSISIFSHGDVGLLQLGNTYLSTSNLNNYQSDVAAWGKALSKDGDLLFYGCNVAANSQSLDFVNQIAQISGADVAASNDLTGDASLGGDWNLEVATGEIETQTFTLTDYNGVLVIRSSDRLNGITADFNGDGKADILRQEKGWWDDDNYNSATMLIANSSGNGFSATSLPESLGIKGEFTNLYVGDFNGDGRSDVLRQEKGAWDDDNSYTAQLLITNYGGTSFTTYTLPESFNLKGDLNNLLIADFNGDGKSDIFVQEQRDYVNDGVSNLLISTGTGFNAISLNISTGLTGGYNNNLYVGDFNGDGKADLLRQGKADNDNNNVNTAQLMISTGTNFSFHSLSESFNLKGDITNLYVGDFNGDGKSDIVRQDKGWADDDNFGTANVLISSGTNFTSYGLAESLSLKGDLTNLYLGDFNGDGKDDLLRQEKGTWDDDNYNSSNVLISSGTNFSSYGLAESFNLKGDLTNLYVGDFNGDGNSDLVRQEKSFADNDDGNTAGLLIATGTNFVSYGLSESLGLKGDQTNLITNNITNIAVLNDS